MQKIALINMPFSSIYRPSLGLGLLKGALVRDGHDVRIFNFNLDFAERTALSTYNWVASMASSLLGEWIFANVLNELEGGEADFFDDYAPEASAADRQALVDMRGEAKPFIDHCLASVDWTAFDIVGFTSVFEQTAASLALARRIKAQHPGIQIALGGANAEGAMGLALLNAYPFVDLVCSGEGDVAFPLYVNSLDSGTPITIAGILRQGIDTKVAHTAMVQRMDELPLPDFTEFFEHFMRTSYGAAEISKTNIPFESSRGCWWGEKSHCKFCGLNGGGMAFRSKSAEKVLAEMLSLKERYHSYTGRFYAVDNILDYKYFKTLLPELRDRDMDLDIFYETKANLGRDQIRLLRDANIRKIQPGIESLSSSILKLMGKGVSAMQNIQLLKYCKEFGITPLWNILYGFPGEDPGEYERLRHLLPALSHLDPPSGYFKMRLDRFSPYFDRSEEEGIVNVRPFRQYGLVHSTISEEHQRDLAYYFDFDYRDGRDPATYLASFGEALQAWIGKRGDEYLFSETIGETLYIFDHRSGFASGLIVFHGVDRLIYELLDRTWGVGNLHQALSQAGHAIEPERLAAKLNQLEKRGLIAIENQQALALAVPVGDYRPPELVDRVFRRAVDRMTQERPPVVAA
jgi:ribosomal peptide maturation radical SAM protein 1